MYDPQNRLWGLWYKCKSNSVTSVRGVYVSLLYLIKCSQRKHIMTCLTAYKEVRGARESTHPKCLKCHRNSVFRIR